MLSIFIVPGESLVCFDRVSCVTLDVGRSALIVLLSLRIIRVWMSVPRTVQYSQDTLLIYRRVCSDTFHKDFHETFHLNTSARTQWTLIASQAE